MEGSVIVLQEQQQAELETIQTETEQARELAALPITDQKTYDLAADTLRECKRRQKQIEGIFAPLVKQANDTVKSIRDEMKKHLEPILAIDAELRRTTAAYIVGQERIRREEEARRLREAEVERKRLEAERQEEAVFLAECGLDEPVQAPVFVAAAPVPEIGKSGISFRDVWKFEITDISIIPREYMIPNEKQIGEVAKALKQLANIPGVRVYSEKIPIVK